jgi:hypothetical protein
VEGTPSTANENGEPDIKPPPAAMVPVIRKTAVAIDGDVTTKLNAEPVVPVKARTGAPLPLGPYVGAEKSFGSPNVAPPADLTVTVHEMASLR